MKYRPLEQYLAGTEDRAVTLTFADIERLIEADLPQSAYRHSAWWSNDPSHVQALAWMDADRQAHLRLKDRLVTFVSIRA